MIEYSQMARPKKRNRYTDGLTIKQRKFVNRYVKTGNGRQSVLEAYDANETTADGLAYRLLQKDKIQRAIDVALAKIGFDEDFAAANLKRVVDEGQNNLDKTRPADVIRAIKLYHDIKGHTEKNIKKDVKKEIEDKIRDMNTIQLKKKLDQLDDKQKRLMEYMEGTLQDGEIVEEENENAERKNQG